MQRFVGLSFCAFFGKSVSGPISRKLTNLCCMYTALCIPCSGLCTAVPVITNVGQLNKQTSTA